MAEYMGFEGLGKSQRIGVRGAASLAEEHGYEYEMLDNGKIKIFTPDGSRTFGPNVKAGSVGKFFGYAKGGAVPMKEQMEMFEDGGLMQEGGTTDPVSGNDVPVGSTQEEVRDDIPAQLSEGEFVFPADVVRFYGLEKLMEMRQNAKAGLQRMKEMGQMGNSEEATLPDDIPFDIEDLDIEDEMGDNNELEMQVGGFVQPQDFTGIQSMQPSAFQNYQPQYVPYQAPTPAQTIAPQYTPATQQVVPTLQQQTPEFKDFISTPTGAYDELREYKNATTGEVRQIPFVGGNPIYPIPEGFEYIDPEKVTTEEVTTTPTTVETAKVVGQQRDGGRDDSTTPSGATIAFGGSINNKGTVSGNYKADISFTGGSIKDVIKGIGAPAGIINFGKQLFSKDNLTPEIPTGMSAIMKNVQLPKTPGSIASPETIAAKVQVDSDFYNKNIANTNVTDRTAMSRTLGWIQDNYSKDFLNNSDNIINAELAFKTMEKEENEKITANKVRRAQSLSGKERDLAFGVKDATSDTGFTKGSIIDNAIKDAEAMVAAEESKSAAYEGGQGGERDRSRDDVSSGKVGVDASGFSTGAGGYGGYD